MMRPNAGLDATTSRPRKQSDPTDRPHLTPTTFFLTRDPDTRPNVSSTSQDDSPLRSLKDTIEDADKQSKYSLPRHRQQDVRSNSRRRSTIRPNVSEDGPQLDGSRQSMPDFQTHPNSVTSSLSTPQGLSLPSSPKSTASPTFPKSDDGMLQDDTDSQAVSSSDDEQDEGLSPEVQDSAPQLIMPSIKMPSRRPFTDRGKQIGRFKILVAGSRGSGKTSLIKSIVQLCEDIVHVDTVPTGSKPTTNDLSKSTSTATAINEVYASTKSYPFWWSDLDESRILKRRKSVGDAVLERNICFVDTSNSGHLDVIMQYLEQQFLKSLNAIHLVGTELTALASGRGGTQVDVVLYLLTKENIREDCNNIRRMSRLCNVVPLISRVDLLAPDLVSDLKNTEMYGISLPQLPFTKSINDSPQASAPYSVSSANGRDVDNMDASLLMSPEYVRPLMPSELALLVQQLFEPNTVSYLRYTSAKKLVSWYAKEPRLTQVPSPSLRSQQPSTLNSPLPTSLSNSGVLIPITSEVSLNTSNSYALAKVADHTYREEHLAQIRLSKWASDLQLSLQRERERYENLAQSERALWLVQRMGEEIRDGQVIPLQTTQAMIKANEKSRILYPDPRYEVHDPLGILRWQDTVRTRGWAALQIIGSFGVMGGVALWLAKTWGLTTSLHEWAQDWTTSLFGTSEQG